MYFGEKMLTANAAFTSSGAGATEMPYFDYYDLNVPLNYSYTYVAPNTGIIDTDATDLMNALKKGPVLIRYRLDSNAVKSVFTVNFDAKEEDDTYIYATSVVASVAGGHEAIVYLQVNTDRIDAYACPTNVYDVLCREQTLSEEDKAQARANIGAATVEEVIQALPLYNGESETI